MHSNTATLSSYFDLIEPAIKQVRLPSEPAGLYDPIRHSLYEVGKRIRPKLVLAGTALCGGDPEKAVAAGVAMELLHNFTLIHDDIMDNADTRRGKPTVFRTWGVPLAILSGDMAFGIAYEQLQVYSTHPSDRSSVYADIHSVFQLSVREVCEGQARDIHFEECDEVGIDSYLEMIRQKTAALLSASLSLGGIIAGASQGQLESLNLLGKEAGLAFQIQDDLLDVIADPSKFGKKVGGDIKEGKKTWLMIKALERVGVKEKALLLEVMKTKSASDAQISFIARLFEEVGVVDDAKLEIKERYLQAMNHLGVFADSPYYLEAKHLFDSLIQRDY